MNFTPQSPITRKAQGYEYSPPSAVAPGTGMGHSTGFSGIKTVDHHEELLEIFRFRYRIYVEGMKRDMAKADHLNRMLFDDLDKQAVHIAAFEDGHVIGCLRINFEVYEKLPEEDLYLYSIFDRPRGRCLVSKAMVDPSHRGSSAFIRMCMKSAEECLQRDATLAFIATGDGLLPLFEKLGFVAYRHFDSWADYGSSNPMTIDLEDHSYLQEVGSPLWPIVKRFHSKRNIRQVV